MNSRTTHRGNINFGGGFGNYGLDNKGVHASRDGKKAHGYGKASTTVAIEK